MKKLLNPRGYLSWSAIDMWMRSKERYKARYFRGEEGFTNDLMEYGKATATAIETGDAGGDELMALSVSLLTKYPTIEHEIRAPMKIAGYEAVDLLGKLDTFDPKTLRFREYKTGRVPWTQARANKHKQLHQYQTLIWLKHGKLAPDVWLDWLETDRDESGRVFLTGNKRSFQVKVGLVEVLEYMALVSKVAVEIDAAWREELKTLN